jgi:hypothetical protein
MLKTIYDAEGKEYTMEGVDAREHLETGRWFAASPLVEETPEIETLKHQARRIQKGD